MRTTLDISDDVLFAAMQVARRERRTIGDVLSAWARASLLRPDPLQAEPTVEESRARCGIQPLPHRGGVVTHELVNRIRDEEGI